MDSFLTFFEKRMRNPLRKKELEGGITNLQWVENEKENLPDERKKQIEKMEEYGVEPERIETFRQAKIKEHEKILKNTYLRTKIDKPVHIMKIYGIDVYKDQYSTEDFSEGSLNYRTLNSILVKLVRDYKDILPNRKPKIVITNTGENPKTKGVGVLGDKSVNPAGVYFNGYIFLNEYGVDDVELLVHEYAHFLADRITKQTQPILKHEYKKMLDEYFNSIQKTKTKRQNLEGKNNEQHRQQMAKKLGLPTDYASSNFDEWFAELIAHWKNMPNNKHTYRFKQILKRVLARI
jgi:hypothetical protein